MIEELFSRYKALTGDTVAASNLVLAHVTAGQRDEPELLDTGQVAVRLGVSRAQVQALARNGQLGHVRVGKLFKFKPEHLTSYLQPAKPSRHW